MQNITALFNTLNITSGHLEVALLNEVNRLHSDINAVEALLEGAPGIKVSQHYLDDALLSAVKGDKVDIARMLLDHGARTEAWNATGDTPLLSACRYASSATARLLIEKGANINAKDRFGNTPVLMAAYRDDAVLVADLAAKGAYLDTKNEDGVTALGFAKERGYKEIAGILKAAGAAEPAIKRKKQHQLAQ